MRLGKKITMIILVIVLSMSTQLECRTQTVAQATIVKLNKKTITLSVGKTQKLKVVGTKNNVKWKSEDTGVAKINKVGIITAVASGKTIIKAKVGKKVFKCKVNVKKQFNESQIKKNVSVNIKDTGRGIVAIFKNNNKVTINIAAKLEYYSNGKIVGAFRDSKYSFEKGKESALFFYAPTDEYHNNIKYDDYKFSFSVKDAFSNYGNVKKERFGALICTDIHGDYSRMENMIYYLNNFDGIDIGACLGDIVLSNYAEDATWYTSLVNKSKKPFITVLGNHDLGNSSDISISGTNNMAFNKFIKPTLKKIGNKLIDKPYYFTDYNKYGIRVITLNCFDNPDDISNNKYLYSRGRYYFSQEQLEWLINTLNSVPNGYHVMIFMHGFGDVPNVENDNFFNSDLGHKLGWYDGNDAKLLYGIVDAWQNASTFSGTYMRSTPNVSICADFTNREKGTFIGYFTGHEHSDIIGTVQGYERQKVFVFCTASSIRAFNNTNDLVRVIGEKSENALTAVFIDKNKRKVILYRIGADLTYSGKQRIFDTVTY